ncbi:ABC transporter permease [Alienimonas californiensis]|uniref:Macrolide export ATP-binding/permease protein MacB n=1 Tax=Alienimonas californiensis TaxID=2527989 RepID=A0A517PDE1_9PLAN|nr:ABC transporter permease [Alienimonas californiensis]QDT17399.1 Macrolide export ATP-binding/permease protein MacB [Alienimonas californiensis]
MFGFAFRNLLSRPARSALALAGLTVAIAGMVGLFGVKGGLEAAAQDAFGKVDGLTAIQPGAPVPLLSRLPAHWEPQIAAVSGVETVVTDVWNRANVIEGKTVVSPPRFLLGTSIVERNQLRNGVYREALTAGRFLNESDLGTTHVYVAAPILEEHGKQVGDTLIVDGIECEIVGAYEVGSLFLDAAILMDLPTMRQVTRFDPNSVSNYYIEGDPGVEPAELKGRILDALRDERTTDWRPSSLLALGGGGASLDGAFDADAQSDADGPGPAPDFTTLFNSLDAAARGKPLPEPDYAQLFDSLGAAPTAAGGERRDPVELRTMDEWLEQFDSFTADLDLFLQILGATGVLIAVFGVVNTMLMSVSERIIEFGILKANGWGKRDVVQLICSESLILGVVGGLLGAAFGWAATEILNVTFPDRLNLYAGPGLLSFAVAFSTVVGTLGGLYPALWAMRMQPMDAIRRG